MKRLVLSVAAAVGLAVVAGVSIARTSRSVDVMEALERAQPERVFAPRLSIETEYRTCVADPAFADSTIAREGCGQNGEAPVALARLERVSESRDPEMLQAAALTALLFRDPDEESLSDAIDRLNKALDLNPGSSALLVNLSAAYLVRGQHTRSTADLTAALEYASQAALRDPRNTAALFNVALAAEVRGLHEQALRAWDRYLAVEADSSWAREARARRDRLAARVPPPRDSMAPWTRAALDSLVARDHGKARELGLDVLLGQWGSATLADSVSAADSLLDLTSHLGNTLSRAGGDLTLHDAIRSIRAAGGSSSALQTLANAHIVFAEAQASKDASTYARVVALNPASPALVAWARTEHLGRTNNPASLPGLDSMLASLDSVRYAALVGRIHWWIGHKLNRRDYQQANHHFGAAARAYRRANETESSGFTRSMEGNTFIELGNDREGWRLAHEALIELRPHRSSVRLSSALLDNAKYLERDDKLLAAALFHEEGLLVANRLNDTVEVVQALLVVADIRARTGDTAGAARYLDSAAVMIPTAVETERAYLRGLLQYVRAQVDRNSIPRSLARIDSSLAGFSEPKRAQWRLEARVRRADLHFDAGDLAGAQADLENVTLQAYDLASRGELDYGSRTAILEKARRRFDQLVMLHVRAGRVREALQVLERARASFARDADTAPGALLPVPRGYVALNYALIGDTLVSWVVRSDSTYQWVRTVDGDALLRAIHDAGVEMGSQAAAGFSDAPAARLYDELIRPMRPWIGNPDSTLVIAVDGELTRISFNGLYDMREDRYLLDDFILRQATSMADAARPARQQKSGGFALLVADPAFDTRANSEKPLDGADAEVDSIAPLYPGARVLRDSAATADSLQALAPNATLIHYAGHAVFDDAQPDRSYLLLAGEGDTGHMRAKSLRALDLGGVRLVVLSACSTLPGREGRSGGFAGLSGALLDAGAGGVIGSPWVVNDKLTAELMEAFHAEYHRTRDPARALRAAQLQMRNSEDPARSSPAAWAGFRYVGR